MNILVAIAPDPIPRWQHWLLDDLRALPGCTVTVRRAGPSGALGLPRGISLLLDLERRAGRGLTDAAHEILGTNGIVDTRHHAAAPIDLALNLSGTEEGLGIARTLTPLFDGHANTTAIWSALLAGRAPQVTLADSEHASAHPLANPAVEDPARLTASFDAIAARLVEGIVAAVGDIAAGRTVTPRAAIDASARTAGAPARFLTRAVAAKLRSRLDRQRGHAPQWSVALRRIGDREPLDPGTLDLSRFHLLPDDSQRYYADPFVFAHQGRTWLFVEDVPDATGRGIISVTELTATVTPATPRPVLERPYHLSYPLVFARDGAIWMMPEAAASGALELYRADPFPHRWVLAARLIDQPLHDATLFHHDGRLWIAAGHCSRRSSTWDGLSLYWAETLLGPWHPHALNPVVLDRRAARPAGHVFTHGGALLRPAQDCTTGYGGALTLNRIDRLDPDHFQEARLGRIDCSSASGVLGPHTLNRGAGYEVIDLYGPRGALSRVGS